MSQQASSLAFVRSTFCQAPDLARLDRWLAQGFEPRIIEAVIREKLAAKPDIRRLSYFENAIQEAHGAPIQTRSARSVIVERESRV